jgi:hypothetical protein
MRNKRKGAFRYFRVIQYDKNKLTNDEGWCNVLVLSGFEIYGELVEKVKVQVEEQEFAFKSHGDDNGLCLDLNFA